MLSRLAARTSRTSSFATRSLLTPRMVAAPSFLRTLKTTPTLMQSTGAAPAAPAADSDGPVEIINRYGAASFWGMVAAVLVTKELFIIDAEFLLSAEILAFMTACYVATGDSFNKWSEDWDAKTKDKFEGANDFMIEMFNQYKMVQSTVQNKPAVMEQYAVEYKAATEAYAAHLTFKPQHEARAKVLAALDAIQGKEAHASAMEWQTTVDTAVANVTAAFSKDAKAQDLMLELAIKNLGYQNIGSTKEAEDPIKALFMKEFA